MADATNVGNVYLAIRADIKRLSQDLAQAEKTAKQGAEKIQSTLDKGVNLASMATKATAAAAVVYGAFRTMQQGMEMAKMGAMLDKQAAAFDNLAAAAGKSSRAMINDLKAASRGLIAESDLMSASGKALLMNIPAEKISELMKIAAATSRMTGQEITDAFNDITLGVARQSRMILDNLGIIVDVDAANEKYAATLGKTASALTEAEKKQAFMNSVLTAGEDMIRRLGSAGNQLEGVNKAIAAQKTAWDEISKSIATMLDGPLSAYAGMIDAIAVKLKGLRESSAASDRNEEQFKINQNRMYERFGLRPAGSTAEMQAAFNKKWVGGSESEAANAAAMAAWRKQDSYASWRQREGQMPDFTQAELDAMRKDQEAQREAWSKRDQSTVFGPSWADYDDGLKVDLKAWSEMKKQHENQQQELIDQNERTWEILAKNQNADIASAVAELERQHKKMVDLSQHTAEAMQDAMADLFFDAMTGKLKTLEDYFNAFYQSIARMASQYMSQQGMGMLMSYFGSAGGGSAASLPINTLPNQPFHSGGIVGMTGGPMRSIPASYYSRAPRLHNGLMPDEYPAILQKGEAVIPRGGSVGGGGGDTYIINAMDTESIVQALRRSGAVPMLAEENIRNNGGLRKAIQTRAR